MVKSGGVGWGGWRRTPSDIHRASSLPVRLMNSEDRVFPYHRLVASCSFAGPDLHSYNDSGRVIGISVTITESKGTKR